MYDDAKWFDNKKTLKQLSYDEANQEYLTDSEIMAVDFDQVKRCYTSNLGVRDRCAHSVDALLYKDDGTLYFVEFKNQKISKGKDAKDLRMKSIESLVIVSDILDQKISNLCKNIDFILVYSAEKNSMAKENAEKEKEKEQEELNRKQQKALTDKYYIVNRVMKKANEELVCFGLETLKKVFFKNVHTFTEEEFQAYLSKNWQEKS